MPRSLLPPALRRSGRPFLAVATASSVLAGGLLPAAPAPAAERTEYGFKTFAFGTLAKATDGSASVDSGRTAYSHLRCTRLAGLSDQESLATVVVPTDDPLMRASAVQSLSRTYRTAAGDTVARSVNRVGELVIGDPQGEHLRIENLTTTATAWADRTGALHAVSRVSSGDIEARTGVAEVDGTLGQADFGVDDLLTVIAEEGGSYEIPGLATLSLGSATPLDGDTGERFARAKARVLRVELHALPGSVVTVGVSFARIDRDPQGGSVGGYATAAELPTAVGGVVSVGRLGHKILPCRGTQGEELANETLAVTVADSPIGLGKATGIVTGTVHEDGRLVAQTTGKLASLTLGDLRVEAIRGRATVTRDPDGRVVRTPRGSAVGSLSVAGEPREVPGPGETLVLPGLARLTFFVTERTPRSLAVTAVRVELLGDEIAPAGTVLELGTAKARVGVR